MQNRVNLRMIMDSHYLYVAVKGWGCDVGPGVLEADLEVLSHKSMDLWL